MKVTLQIDNQFGRFKTRVVVNGLTTAIKMSEMRVILMKHIRN